MDKYFNDIVDAIELDNKDGYDILDLMSLNLRKLK